MFKIFKKASLEITIISMIKEELKNTSFLAELRLNGIRSRACSLMMEGKLSEEFYLKVFSLNIKDYPGKAYWEIPENLGYIMTYREKA